MQNVRSARRKGLRAALPMVWAGLVWAGAGMPLGAIERASQPAASRAAGIEPDPRRDAAVVAVERAMPGVVNIATARVVEYRDAYDTLLREFYGVNRPTRRAEELNSIGSGVIIDEEGYVLTNFHVLRRATRVQVKLWDGRVYEADPIVATGGSDVALLKIRAGAGEKFTPVRLAGEDDLLLGETVLALGNPYGLGESVTRGILSSKNRRPPTDDEPLNVADWLQTDAAINPGNSGGPLINLRGELIGLNVAVGRGQGIGFAIPVKQVNAALSQFFTPEVLHGLWFGARISAQAEAAAGLVVTAVQAGSPAEQAGLRAGQRITQVNGKSPRNLVDFVGLLAADGGKAVRLRVGGADGGRELGRVRLIPFDEVILKKVGLELRKLPGEEVAGFGTRAGEGLLVSAVEEEGPADRAKIQRGCLLTGIDGQVAWDLWTVASVLSGKKSGEPVQLTLVVPRRWGGGYVQGTATLRVR